MPFSELPHTGDLQYRVTGATLEEVFSDAAKALFSTITDLTSLEEDEQMTVTASAADLPTLLIDFLRACLDVFPIGEFIACACTTELVRQKDEQWSLRATLTGTRYDPARHPFRTEIKAVTYHGAELKQTTKGWEATFTLDL